MRLIFMGTAAFAVPSLERLASGPHVVGGVVTQPDRPGGRGQKSRVPPVGEVARTLGLEVAQPESLAMSLFRTWVEERCPDAVVVVAYGKLIPGWLIHYPRFGVVNLHPSLLPRYRGAAPVNWAIARGEIRTGVCTMQVDEGMDTGPVFTCRETEITSDESAPDVLARLAVMGSSLLMETLDALERGQAFPKPQDDREATFAPLLKREDGYIRWEEPASVIHNKVRAFLPWPGVVVGFREQRCRLLKSRLVSGNLVSNPPGELAVDNGSLRVVCGDGRLIEIVSLQLENRKGMSARDFTNGFRPIRGERMTSLASTTARDSSGNRTK